MRKYLMLLWHMHQPFYKDLAEGAYTMPWVRLHALKDYYGMVAMLREFPAVHATFNLVPSLIIQLEEYARGEAREESFELAFKPADQLTSKERENLSIAAFQVNRENLMSRYPRFKELYELAHRTGQSAPEVRRFSADDFRDLQVLSQLAWFDEVYLANDPEVKRLVKKGRDYSENDKSILFGKESEIFKVTLEEYRQAAERGQIEISTSPFYHPILPLLCDTDIAAESHPGVRLPQRRFMHPEDARDQLQAAIALSERVFGKRPQGLWPSEGSVSDEVLRLAASEGFGWAATDEGVLGRSLQLGFYRQPDGTVWNGHELYRPHRFAAGEREISIFFRDHELSDLIGFVYSRMDAHQAAADLHRRIRAAAASTGDRPSVVSVILDGENAWEFFPGNGREFLKSFFGRIAADPELQAVTASEALELVEAGKLTHVVPGSWINANFDVWIGAEEDNRAWDLLANARDYFASHSRLPTVSPQLAMVAQEELWIAEGSDWNWWYGPEHSTANDEEFDRLYRTHLSNVYRLLGGSPPDELAAPIKHVKAKETITPPSGLIDPTIDGHVSSYFEWLGAGVYTPDPSSGSMHGAAQFVEALYYGYNRQALFLRIDFNPAFLSEHQDFEVRIHCCGRSSARLEATVEKGRVGHIRCWKGEEQSPTVLAAEQARAAFSRILEVLLRYDLLEVNLRDRIQVEVSLWIEQLPIQMIPHTGSLNIELTESFEA
jgi:alpha-amylase/alpha-mannosidase (GH57 family)